MTMDTNEYRGGQKSEDFEVRLVRALEAAPIVTIPQDFARRVAMKAPARMLANGQTVAEHYIGLRVAWAVTTLLLVAMFSLAMLPVGIRAAHWLEFAFATDFAALTAWLSIRTLRQSS